MDWSFSHVVDFGYYLDCPKDNTPSSKILLQKNNDPSFQQAIMSFVKLERGKKKQLPWEKERERSNLRGRETQTQV
jgi:hypothetical protein